MQIIYNFKDVLKTTKIFLFMSILVNAGDPCPIQFKFYDAGIPSWLNQEEVLSTLSNKSFWLGIDYSTKLEKNGTLGIKITKIYKNSPAELSGLKAGDYITKIDNVPIAKQDKNTPFDKVLMQKNLNDSITFSLLRDEKKQKVSLILNQTRDPLIVKLSQQLVDDRERKNRKFPCTHVKHSVLEKEKKKKVHAEIFLKNKRFDCENAHKKISDLKLVDEYSKGNVFVIRGSKRILFVHLGWKTMCVNYNGNLTQTQRRKVLSTLFDDYIKDRHLNP